MSCGGASCRTLDACCRPSVLAEFVNGLGSLERSRGEGWQPHPGCHCSMEQPCCDDTSPTRVIIMPLCIPRQTTPPPQNRLASIDILEQMLPALGNGNGQGGCCCCGVVQSGRSSRKIKSSRRHRITFQMENCKPMRKWPDLPLPTRGPGPPINPIPPGVGQPEGSAEEDADWDKKDSGTYYYNKAEGRFVPVSRSQERQLSKRSSKQRRRSQKDKTTPCRSPRMIVMRQSCEPPPPPMYIPWPMFPGCQPQPPAPQCQVMPMSNYPGAMSLNLGQGAPQCFMYPPGEGRQRRRRNRNGNQGQGPNPVSDEPNEEQNHVVIHKKRNSKRAKLKA